MQYPRRHIAQFRGTDLEKFVAGQGLQNMDERLAVMSVGRMAGIVDNLSDLATNNGDRLDLLGIDGRCKQSDEQTLPHRVAAGIEFLDHNGVKMNAAMNGRTLVRLVDKDKRGALHEGGKVGRQHRAVGNPLDHGYLVVAQQAQARPGNNR